MIMESCSSPEAVRMLMAAHTVNVLISRLSGRGRGPPEVRGQPGIA